MKCVHACSGLRLACLVLLQALYLACPITYQILLHRYQLAALAMLCNIDCPETRALWQLKWLVLMRSACAQALKTPEGTGGPAAASPVNRCAMTNWLLISGGLGLAHLLERHWSRLWPGKLPWRIQGYVGLRTGVCCAGLPGSLKMGQRLPARGLSTEACHQMLALAGMSQKPCPVPAHQVQPWPFKVPRFALQCWQHLWFHPVKFPA